MSYVKEDKFKVYNVFNVNDFLAILSKPLKKEIVVNYFKTIGLADNILNMEVFDSNEKYPQEIKFKCLCNKTVDLYLTEFNKVFNSEKINIAPYNYYNDLNGFYYTLDNVKEFIDNIGCKFYDIKKTNLSIYNDDNQFLYLKDDYILRYKCFCGNESEMGLSNFINRYENLVEFESYFYEQMEYISMYKNVKDFCSSI